MSVIKNRVMDNKYDFVEKVKKEEYYEIVSNSYNSLGREEEGLPLVSCSEWRSNLFDNCYPYVSIGVTSSGSTQTIVRTYETILKNLSEIGGLYGLGMLLGSFLLGVLVRNKGKRFLVKNVLGLNPKEVLEGNKDESNDDKMMGGKGKDKKGKDSSLASLTLKKCMSKDMRQRVYNPGFKWTEERIESYLEDLVERNQDVVEIFKTQHFLWMIKDIAIGPNARKLLPLVLIGKILKSQEQKKLKENAKKAQEKSSPRNAENDSISLREAYLKVLHGKPEGELEGRIRGQILELIPPEFSNSINTAPRKRTSRTTESQFGQNG